MSVKAKRKASDKSAVANLSLVATNEDRLSREDAHYRAVPAVTRAIAIMRLLGTSDAPLGVNAIASRIDIFPSTALHILRVLVREELVNFDAATKHYSLDAGILSLARGLLRPGSFGIRIQQVLDRLANKHRVTTLAVRVIGLDHIVVVATAGSGLGMRIQVEIGSRFPALMSATGRCVAAFGNFSADEIEGRFPALRWDKPPTFGAWKRQVEETKRRRYSVDRGNYLSGVTIVAAPVVDHKNSLTHVIVALTLNGRTDIEGLARDLRIASQEASKSMH